MSRIEQELDTIPGYQLTIPSLRAYVNTLVNVTLALRQASEEEVRRCLQSRDGVLFYIREARDDLQVSLQYLIDKGDKGKNSRYFAYLRKAQSKLADALRRWP